MVDASARTRNTRHRHGGDVILGVLGLWKEKAICEIKKQRVSFGCRDGFLRNQKWILLVFHAPISFVTEQSADLRKGWEADKLVTIDNCFHSLYFA